MTRGFKLGEVRAPKQEDFEDFKEFVADNHGWEQHYPKIRKSGSTKGYTRILNGSGVRAAKIESRFDDLCAADLYDSLHDPDFRITWDDAMREVKSPFGLKDRDFVNQRAWYEDGHTFIIMNHSVAHAHKPPVANVQRGVSFLTGYLILATGPNSCDFTFISHSDPLGKIPTWVVNAAVKTYAPIITKRLHDAACGYATWKANNRPTYKPWSNFDQLKEFPPVNPDDIGDLTSVLENIRNSHSSDEEEIPIHGGVIESTC